MGKKQNGLNKAAILHAKAPFRTEENMILLEGES